MLPKKRSTIIDESSTVPVPAPHTIRIEPNIPIAKDTRGRKPRWPFIDMKIGDSIEVLQIEADRARAGATNTTRKYGFRFTSRKTEKGIRIWRIE